MDTDSIVNILKNPDKNVFLFRRTYMTILI